jgi:hypothetical protein
MFEILTDRLNITNQQDIYNFSLFYGNNYKSHILHRKVFDEFQFNSQSDDS